MDQWLAGSNGTRGYDSLESYETKEMRTRLSMRELRHLIELMDTSEIEEITIEHEAGGLRLTLRKPARLAVPAPAAAAIATDLAEAEELEEEGAESGQEAVPREPVVEVRAPLVGIFRLAMRPGDMPLVRKGDTVGPEQVVGAIEALNYLNEVEAGAAGRVKELRVHDGDPVEYGQLLLLIEPAPGSKASG